MLPGYFKCNYCYTFSKDKNWILSHEKKCTYNPNSKHCDSCKWRKLKITEDEIKEYICEKNFKIDKTFIACEGKYYTKASIPELQLRAQKKEFE